MAINGEPPSVKRAKLEEADGDSRFNAVFQSFPVDNLYHFGLDTANDPLQKMFGNVTAVCLMGSPARAEGFAKLLSSRTGGCIEAAPVNLSKTDRCQLYKVGKIMTLSHGMGMPSCLIFLHELAKLLFHAKADLANICMIRLGTSGGIGVPGGSVVLSEQGMDACLQLGYDRVALGRKTREPAVADASLNEEIIAANTGAAAADPLGFKLVKGVTITTEDYYDAQGRRDGALPLWYSEEEKIAFLRKAHELGVRNMEMEAAVVLWFFQRLKIRAAVACAALLDRLEGDQHAHSREDIHEWSLRPQKVVMNYLKAKSLI
jgi:uridine phosphorylase